MTDVVDTDAGEQVATCSQSTDAAPIDLTHLSRYTMGNRELEQEVLELFRSHTVTQLRNLQDALGNSEKWHQATHAVKGSARGIGAWSLATAAELAEMDRMEAKSNHVAHLGQLRERIVTTNAFITQLIGER